MDVFSTAVTVAGTMFGVLAVVAGWVRMWAKGLRNGIDEKIDELAKSNTAQHAKSNLKLDELATEIKKVSPYFDEHGPLAREVGTVPKRLRDLEAGAVPE